MLKEIFKKFKEKPDAHGMRGVLPQDQDKISLN